VRKILGGSLIGVVVLAAAGWMVFVPSAKEPPYEFVKAWGSKGSDPGQFSDPTGVAISGDEVFVADSRNGRIQVFDLDGNFKRMFGKPGDQPGALGRPMNLTADDGELYVPEYFNDRIQVFGLDGTPKRIIGGPGSGPGEFSGPGGVAVGKNGELYVADFYGQRVQALKPDGAFIRQWGQTGRTSHAVGSFYYPTDVAVDRTGDVYMADGYGNRIQVFRPDGAFLRKWGGPLARGIYGPFNGWFTTVTSIAFGPEGNLFTADFYNDRVQKFSPDGTYLTSFGSKGAGPGRFDHPLAVAAGDDGAVFVADLGNNRIQKWRPARRQQQGDRDERKHP
jgi:DNA-binding beta-propeller fold protein YncE